MHHYPAPRDSSGDPVELGATLWSSAMDNWSGFHLEVMKMAKVGCLRDLTDRCAGVALLLSGSPHVEMQADGARQHGVAGAGSMVLSGRHYQWKTYDWSGSHDMLFVELDLSRIASLVSPGEFACIESPQRQFLIQDSSMSALLFSMLSSARDGAGALFAQSISLALAALVADRFTNSRSENNGSAKLSTKQLKLLDDYAMTHLGDNLSLEEMASLVNLSASRFRQLFKNSTGAAPHQYFLQRRIRESMRLLRTGRVSIAEIALATGFADQSHFTKVFKQMTATTPRAFQVKHAFSSTPTIFQILEAGAADLNVL